jgi:hypothetical protein
VPPVNLTLGKVIVPERVPRRVQRIERPDFEVVEPPKKRGNGVGRNGNLVRMKKGELLPGGGRPKGSPNKVTRVVRDWILEATELSGMDGKGKDGALGYLVWLSRKEPVAYAALLARIMPMQIQATLNGSISGEVVHKLSANELQQRLKERGLPVPSLIDHDPSEFDVITDDKDDD